MSTVTQKAIEFTKLFESMQEPCIVFAVDEPSFTIIAQNDAHMRMTQSRREDILGTSVFEAFRYTSDENGRKGADELLNSLRTVVDTAESNLMSVTRYDIKDHNGRYHEKYWQVENFPLIDDDGEVYAIFQNSKDITDETLAEKKLEEVRQKLGQTEETFRFMANTIPHLVWIARPNGKSEFFNDRWYEYTGNKDKNIDAVSIELLHKDDQERVRKAWRKCIKTGEPYVEEYRLFHASSQSYRWVIGRAEPYRNKIGEIVKWYGTCTDIQDRKHAVEIQEFLLEVSKKLSSTLEFDKILKTICELCVPKVADWCSIDLLDEAKQNFNQVSVIHKDTKKIALAKKFRKYDPIDVSGPTGVANVVRTGKIEFYPQITSEMIDMAIDDPKKNKFMKDLKLRSIIIAPLRISRKTVGAITLVASDSDRSFTQEDVDMVEILSARISLAITNAKLYTDSLEDLKKRKQLQREILHEKQKLESRVKERTQQLQLTNEGLREEIIRRKKVEAELSEHSELLVRSNKELEDFAYVASHDLQEPLRKIQAFGDLLLHEFSSDLSEEAMDYLRRLHAASNRMSTLIEDLLEFSRVTTRQRPVRHVDMNKIAHDVIGDLQARVEETNAQIVVKKLPDVCASSTHMRQLLQNLIGNAIKFHKPNMTPKITVTGKKMHNMVEISIKDNGIGFDKKYSDKIFDVFKRLNERSKYEGTGIGLAVCRKIVEKYNGEITVNSKVGVGTTFLVSLPASRKD